MKKAKKVNFSLGERITISSTHSWAKGAVGVISTPPDAVKESSEEWDEGYYREINTPRGIKRFYWVKLGSPHFDADGDGPYEEGEIEHSFIESIKRG